MNLAGSFGLSHAGLPKAHDDPDPQPNGFFGTLSIEQGKAFLAKLDEVAKKGEGALEALVVVHEDRTPPTA